METAENQILALLQTAVAQLERRLLEALPDTTLEVPGNGGVLALRTRFDCRGLNFEPRSGGSFRLAETKRIENFFVLDVLPDLLAKVSEHGPKAQSTAHIQASLALFALLGILRGASDMVGVLLAPESPAGGAA